MLVDIHFQTHDGRLVILSKSDAFALYQELAALFNPPIKINQYTDKMRAGSPIGQGGQASSSTISDEEWKSIMASETEAANAETDNSVEESTGTLRENDDAQADKPYCDCFHCDPAEHNHI